MAILTFAMSRALLLPASLEVEATCIAPFDAVFRALRASGLNALEFAHLG